MDTLCGLRGLRIAILGAIVAAGCGGSGKGGAPGDPPPVSTSPGADGGAPWVNVFIGTAPASVTDPVPNGAGGSTFPGAALPFGMIQWGPDTPGSAPPGYLYTDSQITGFSLTHLDGAGCPAMRDFPVFPVSGPYDPSDDPIDSFSHSAEIASPGFYEVTLGSGVLVDLTATQRTGFARFTFPHGREGTVIIAGGLRHDGLYVRDPEIQIGSDGLVTGQRTDAFFCGTAPTYPIYFAARFDRPFADSGTYSGGVATPGGTQVSGTDTGVTFGFDTSSDAAVQMKIGLSYVSIDNAVANLDAESPGWDFDAVHQAAIAQWNEALGRVAVEGGSDDDKTAFYTALYHVLLQPAVVSDANGDFVGLDGQVKNTGALRYANYSGWDIYRSWMPLVAVVAPDQASGILRSLTDAGTECGLLPKWELASIEASLMVGDPSPAIVAGGYAFGARGFDASAALALMVKAATDTTATCNGLGPRPGLATYLDRHYCPLDAPDAPVGTVSYTLEYAIDDFAIAQLAGALGDAQTHDQFMARAGYWRNVFDASRTQGGFTGYVQPRYMADVGGAPAFETIDVTRHDPFDLQSSDGLVEGNATQYTLAIPHDVPGLIAALGGDAQLVARLDSLFTQVNAGLRQPYFYMGNEPGFVTPWEYPFAGAPSKTQAIVRRILHEAFGTGPEGLPGNDDLGAMSSWQVWAMLGMYPAMQGVGGVVLGSPTFPKATITLAGGAQLVITADGAGPDAPYVQGLLVNGQPSTSTWLAWDTVAGGGTLAFTLGTSPSATWGTGQADRPPVPN
jgi:predicted alpha-1,2-mannosidase